MLVRFVFNEKTVLVSCDVETYPNEPTPVKEDVSSSDFPNDVLVRFVSKEKTVLVSWDVEIYRVDANPDTVLVSCVEEI